MIIEEAVRIAGILVKSSKFAALTSPQVMAIEVLIALAQAVARGRGSWMVSDDYGMMQEVDDRRRPGAWRAITFPLDELNSIESRDWLRKKEA